MSAGDNTEKVSQARQLISTSILGLVIVLSPVIVFSIINPSILSLKVNFTNLAPANVPNAPPASSSGAGINSTISQGDKGASCTGTVTYSCANPNASGSAGTAAVLAGNTCPSGYTLYTTCGTPAGSTPDVCSQYTGKEAMPLDDYSGSGQAIDNNCCGSTLQDGYQCYGTKK